MAVPFFSEKVYKKMNKTFLKFQMHYQWNYQMCNLIAKSLQVPCIFPLKNIAENLFKGKRVLPFTSLRTGRISASITAEAALCLPLYLFCAAALLEPIRWLDRQRQIQTVTETLCGDLSQYMYVKMTAESDNVDAVFPEKAEAEEEKYGEIRGEERDEYGYLSLLSGAAAGVWLKRKAEQYADRVKIKEARVSGDSGEIWFEIEYKEKIPFFPVRPEGVSMSVSSKRRGWIGLDGKLERRKETENTGDRSDAEGELVYVGAGKGKYHLYRNCHYISNEYDAVTRKQAETLRNTSGERYQACQRCAGGENSETIVYITRGGNHYHCQSSCSAMVSYIQSVPVEQAVHLGLCSYCERKKAEGGG